MSSATVQLIKLEALLRKGRIEDARRLCDRLVRGNPGNVGLLLSLVRVAYSTAAYSITVDLCAQISARQPGLVPALLYRGLALAALGKTESAIQAFQQGLTAQPESWELHVNLGMAFDRLDRTQDAIAAYESAIRINPRCVEALNNLGNTLHNLDRDEEAVERYSQALALSPGYVVTLYNRGIALNRLGRFRLALKDFDTVLGIQPDFVPALSDRSYALAFLGRLEDALASCEKALALFPDFGPAIANRGVVLNHLGRFDEARDTFVRAQAILGETVEILNGRALALRCTSQLEGALECHRRAIDLFPKSVQGFIDLGVTLTEMDEIDQALASYDAALELDPECPDVHMNKGLLELGQGHFIAGWRGYEYRFTRRGAEPRVFQTIATWKGEELAGEQRLLVWSEQGVGDEVLFASIYPELAYLGARCVIECRAKLAALFRRSFSWATYVVRDQPLPENLNSSIAYQIPAASLGRIFRRRLEDFPRHSGYLLSDPVRVATWKTRLDALGPGLKVGFSWRSSNLAADRALTCTTLDQWGALFDVAGVHWVSLQYDDCVAELDAARARFGIPLHRFPDLDYYDDLDELAALMRTLDLVITAPTSVSMQSAALGVPTWQISYGHEWQTHGTGGFPWFPALVRFNRRWNQPWPAVFDAIAMQLGKLIEDKLPGCIPSAAINK